MAGKCCKCGSWDNYNFAINNGMCNICIGKELERIKELEEAIGIARIKLEAIKIRSKKSPRSRGNKPIWVIAKTGLEEIEQALKG